MMAQIIKFVEYRKAKAAQEVRRVVNGYFAEHSQVMAWWLSSSCRGRLQTPESTGLTAISNASANAVPISRLEI